MEILLNTHRRNPNEKVQSLYWGVSPNGGTMTSVVKPSADRNRMETIREEGAMLPRGVGGQIAVLVLGGMETTLDEVQYILEARREKGFTPKRKENEIAGMCKLVTDRRNERIMEERKRLKANPSLKPAMRERPTLYLPVGYKYAPTREPGFHIRVRG